MVPNSHSRRTDVRGAASMEWRAEERSVWSALRVRALDDGGGAAGGEWGRTTSSRRKLAHVYVHVFTVEGLRS